VWRVKACAIYRTPLLRVNVQSNFRFWKCPQFNSSQSTQCSNHDRGNGGRVLKTNTAKFTHLAVPLFLFPSPCPPSSPRLSSFLYQLLFLALQSDFLLHSASLYRLLPECLISYFFSVQLSLVVCVIAILHRASSSQNPCLIPEEPVNWGFRGSSSGPGTSQMSVLSSVSAGGELKHFLCFSFLVECCWRMAQGSIPAFACLSNRGLHFSLDLAIGSRAAYSHSGAVADN